MTRVLIPIAGVVTFAVVYIVLQLGLRLAPAGVGVATPAPVLRDSLATRLGDGQVAVALPVSGAQTLVIGLQPGARLDVLASVPESATGRPLTALVTRGATVVQPVTSSDPMLVSVDPPDALVLAHLVLGGTPLTYTVWAGGVAPVESPPLDEGTARAMLGLPAPTRTPAPTAVPAPTLAPAPTATAVPTAVPPRLNAVADRYIVQPGESLPSIAAQIGIDAERLRAANPDVPPEGELPPGMQLVVPQ